MRRSRSRISRMSSARRARDGSAPAHSDARASTSPRRPRSLSSAGSKDSRARQGSRRSSWISWIRLWTSPSLDSRRCRCSATSSGSPERDSPEAARTSNSLIRRSRRRTGSRVCSRSRTTRALSRSPRSTVSASATRSRSSDTSRIRPSSSRTPCRRRRSSRIFSRAWRPSCRPRRLGRQSVPASSCNSSTTRRAGRRSEAPMAPRRRS